MKRKTMRRRKKKTTVKGSHNNILVSHLNKLLSILVHYATINIWP